MHFVLYVADEQIFSCGPFATEADVIKFCKEKNGDEFDIESQHVYHLCPDNQLIELCSNDLGDEN